MELKEVLEKALKLETDGRKFYREAASLSKDSEAKVMFERLASDEKDHFAYIQRQYDDLRAGRGWSFIRELEKVSALDIAAPIFPKGRAIPKALPRNPTEEDALLFALAAEMNSYELYHNASAQTSDTEARQMFLQLSQAESGHFSTLMLYYEGRYSYPR